jgi:hypothetical protein
LFRASIPTSRSLSQRGVFSQWIELTYAANPSEQIVLMLSN